MKIMCEIYLRHLGLPVQHLNLLMLSYKVFYRNIQPEDVLHNEFLFHIFFIGRSQHFQRLTQSIASFPHFVWVQGSSQNNQCNFKDNLDALTKEAVPHSQQSVPGKSSSHSTQEPIRHVKQWVYFVLQKVTMNGWRCFFQEGV